MEKQIKLLLVIILPIIFSQFATPAEYLTTNEMNSSSPFGNIFLTIPSGFEDVYPGENVIANVKLMNLRSDSRVDVMLDFVIDDPNKNVIFSKKETIAVETQASLVRTFAVPENAMPGRYTIYITLIYADGNETAAEASFLVSEIPKADNNYFEIFVTVIGVVILIFLIYFATKIKEIITKLSLRMQVRAIVKRRLNSLK